MSGWVVDSLLTCRDEGECDTPRGAVRETGGVVVRARVAG